MRGLDLGLHRTRFGVDMLKEHAAELSRLREAGLIEVEADLLRLTRDGALLSNEVFTVFV
jgi:coproporphyrinogen III oxidase-like Fe-S oxidoreductase